MAEKYVFYTMGNEEINEAVREILLKKGYEKGGWGQDAHVIYIYMQPHWGYTVPSFEYDTEIYSSTLDKFKEITFRELCELPDVHDELEELANHLFLEIDAHWKTVKHKEENQLFDFNSWCRKQNWCKVQELVEKKLGLGKE